MAAGALAYQAPLEQEACAIEDEAELSGEATPPQAGVRARRVAAWAGGLLGVSLLVAPAVVLARHSRTPPATALETPAGKLAHFLVQEDAQPNCEAWFSVGHDCSTDEEWTCTTPKNPNARWTTGFKCCCEHGWGSFSKVAGLITWAAHPDRCLDVTMPYVGSGVPFDKSTLMLSHCGWGNPNKQFHVSPGGTGNIQWASHPGKCLYSNGNQVGMQGCWTGDTNAKNFDMSGGGKDLSKPRQIKLQSQPNMCLEVPGGSKSYAPNDGTQIQIQPCQQGKPSQLFKLTTYKEPKYSSVPKLFCISLMLPKGYEAGLLKAQHLGRPLKAKKPDFGRPVGIFECNDWAVYSNKSIVIQKKTKHVKEVKTTVMDIDLSVKFGGKWNTALNTDVFIGFWDRVLEDERTWKNDWVVKIDPDAVFFPQRLQEILRNRWYSGVAGAKDEDDEGKPMFLNNCHRGMHGPIEVISRKGLEVYKKHKKDCVEGEPYKHKQEDFYFRRCWELLEIEKVEVYNLLFENKYACDERSDTRDGRHPCFSRQVSFHPYKTEEGYFQCYKRGNAMHWPQPMLINEQNPGHSNFHHA